MMLALPLFVITIFLSLLGIFILYESSFYTALLNIGNKYYFIKNQIVWVILGIFITIFLSRVNYKRFYYFAVPGLVGSVLLLILVFVPGIGLALKGANRWIDFGFFVFQPSELLKVTFSLYLAAWLSSKEKGRFFAFLLLYCFCILLVALEPDLGTAIIIALTSIGVYFLSGARFSEMFLILFLSIIAVSALIVVEPYRMERFLNFSNFNEKDLSGASYHTRQILIALGSSGITGVGIGNSVQKYGYIPESTTDSIFAIYGEETGFIGSVFLILIFIVQLILGFLIAYGARDQFGRLWACGILIFLSTQTILNLASQVVIVPLTGIPLPFISYGGSSMIINFASIGILLSISRSSAS